MVTASSTMSNSSAVIPDEETPKVNSPVSLMGLEPRVLSSQEKVP